MNSEGLEYRQMDIRRVVVTGAPPRNPRGTATDQ
jgi:hypothetical protein